METEGYTRFGGKMTGQTFTAHPKVDPAHRQHDRLRLRRLRAVHRRLYFYEVTPAGELVRETGSRSPTTA